MKNLLIDMLMFLKDKPLYEYVNMKSFFIDGKYFDCKSVTGKRLFIAMKDSLHDEGLILNSHKSTDTTHIKSELAEDIPVNEMTHISFCLTIKGFLFITDYLRQLDNASFIQRQTKAAEDSTQSVVNTNKNVRLTNKIIWVSVLASCISAVATVMAYKVADRTFHAEALKDTTHKQIAQLQQQLQKDTFRLSFLTHQNDSLKNKIDSLLHVSKNYK